MLAQFWRIGAYRKKTLHLHKTIEMQIKHANPLRQLYESIINQLCSIAVIIIFKGSIDSIE